MLARCNMGSRNGVVGQISSNVSVVGVVALHIGVGGRGAGTVSLARYKLWQP